MTIKRIIGIDFGNTDTVVAYRDHVDNNASENIHYLHGTNSLQRTIPSRVMMKGQQVWCGEEATDENALSSLKTMLGDAQTQSMAKLAIIEFFKYLYRLYEEQTRDDGKEPDIIQTVIAIPDASECEAGQFLIHAAAEAGFPQVMAFDEAMLIVGGYLIRDLDRLQERTAPRKDGSLWFLMIDSGRNKTDVVLQHYLPQEEGKLQKFILKPQELKNHFFGGSQIDSAIVALVTDQIKSATGNPVNITAFQNEYGQEIENWKREQFCPRLSERWFISSCPVLEKYAKKMGIDRLKFGKLDRYSFQRAVYFFGQNFVNLINECLIHAVESVPEFSSADNIDFAILTGGNSNWYLLKDMLTSFLPDFGVIHLKQFQTNYERILTQDDPKMSVVNGATLLSFFSTGMLKEIVTVDASAKRVIRITGNAEMDEKNLEEYVVENPQDVEALNHLGCLLTSAKRYSEAEGYFVQAQQADPQIIATYVNLGNLFCYQNRWGDAEATYKNGLTNCKKNGELSFHLAEVLLVMNQNEKAVKAFQQTASAGYDTKSLYLHWAQAWQNLKKVDEAISVLQRGIENAPDTVENYLELAKIFLAEKQYASAEDILNQALGKHPEDERTSTLLGEVYEVNGKVENAIQVYEKTLLIAPESPIVLAALGRLYLAQGNFEESERLTCAALKIEPGADLDYQLCTLYKVSGRKEQAAIQLQEAMRKYPQEARFVVFHAELLEDEKKFDEAVKDYRHALQIDERNLTALSRLGNLLDDLGQSAEAIECFRKLIEIDPTNATAYKNLGYLLECQKDFAAAEDAYWKAIQYDPEDLSSYHYLGEMLNSQGRHDEAEAVLKVVRRKEDLKIELSK
jgi:tetratricopeptide (TPR) repeat protein